MAATYQQQNIAVSEQQPVVQIVNPVQQQIAVVGQRSHSTTVANNSPKHRYIKVIRSFGISECILGGLSVLLAVVADAIVSREFGNSGFGQSGSDFTYYYYHNRDFYNRYRSATASIGLTYSSQGICCGIFVIITGVFGMRIMNTSSRGMHITNMAIAIITAIVGSLGCVISGLAAAFSTFSVIMVALHSVITILIFVSVIVTITHSAFCCNGVYSSKKSVSTQQVVYYTQQNTMQPQQQYGQGLNGQILMIVNQPMMPQTIQHVPLTSTLQQAPVIVNTVTTPMPPTNTQNPAETHQTESENAPPSYLPVV